MEGPRKSSVQGEGQTESPLRGQIQALPPPTLHLGPSRQAWANGPQPCGDSQTSGGGESQVTLRETSFLWIRLAPTGEASRVVGRRGISREAKNAPFYWMLRDYPGLPDLLLQGTCVFGSVVCSADSSVKSLAPRSYSIPARSSCALRRLWTSPNV